MNAEPSYWRFLNGIAIAPALMALTLAGWLAAAAAGPAQAAGATASAWVKGHNSNVRLIAGAFPPDGSGPARLLVGVEMRLADGWKTYWRSPGDDGGLPPTFDWSGSRNLKSAKVRYPAPQRLKSKTGTSIGYSKFVVFPVEIEPEAPDSPVDVSLNFEFGICRDICVPAEARMALRLSPDLSLMPPDLAAALKRVPLPTADAGTILKSAKANLKGSSPYISFDILVGAAGDNADLFVEATDATHLPMPRKSGGSSQGVQSFRLDLKDAETVAALAGKQLRLTVIGAGNASEVTWQVR